MSVDSYTGIDLSEGSYYKNNRSNSMPTTPDNKRESKYTCDTCGAPYPDYFNKKPKAVNHVCFSRRREEDARDEAIFHDLKRECCGICACCKKCYRYEDSSCFDGNCSCHKEKTYDMPSENATTIRIGGTASPGPFLTRTLKEFDEKYVNDPNYWLGYTHVKPPTAASQNVKEFLRSALNAQREEIREKVKKLKRFIQAPDDLPNQMYNKAIQDILTLLSPNNKENE